MAAASKAGVRRSSAWRLLWRPPVKITAAPPGGAPVRLAGPPLPRCRTRRGERAMPHRCAPRRRYCAARLSPSAKSALRPTSFAISCSVPSAVGILREIAFYEDCADDDSRTFRRGGDGGNGPREDEYFAVRTLRAAHARCPGPDAV